MRLLVVLCVSALLLAGCADSTPSADDDDDVVIQPQYEDKDRNFTVDAPKLPVEPPAPGERTHLEAPQWRLGEWWRIRITEHFAGDSWEIMRVVAGSERGDYLVGFPIEEFNNDALVMHMPGYGDILADLSYSAHDVPFVPVQFPLVEGDQWTTAWESPGATMDMLVEEVRPDGTVLITGSPTGTGAYATEIVYDVEMGEVSRLVMDGYADYEVIGHGYGFQGDVRVPHDHDLVLLNGRVAGVHDGSGPLLSPNPAGPTETISVEGTYDRISFALLMMDVGAQAAGGPPAGAYSVRLTAPDGTVYEDSMDPTHGTWIKAAFHGHEGPVGDWQLQAVAAGPGGAFAEGIAYHSIDIALPSGCVLESDNAGHHGTLCREGRSSEGLA